MGNGRASGGKRMSREIFFRVTDALPQPDEILASQGMPGRAGLPSRIVKLCEAALDLYETLVEPRGIMESISSRDFADVYRGEGGNAERTPLEEIFPRAKALALFAATVGEPVGAKIRELFEDNDPALGYMLDSAASLGAENLAAAMENRFARRIAGDGAPPWEGKVLAYSPGYCGWHVSGQKKLFASLHPEEIGIRLNASFLMQPLKSVSGVLVAGPREIHRFRPAFRFCEDCTTRSCRERMAALFKGRAD